MLGFSNSGKTTVATAIVAEARRRKRKVAVIKVGRRHQDAPVGNAATADASVAGSLPDTEQYAAAGADPVVFRTPRGWSMESVDPLEDGRDVPLRLPAWLQDALVSVDVLVIEGRRIPGAVVVQTVGRDGARKFDAAGCDFVLEHVPDDPLPETLKSAIFDAEEYRRER